MKNKEQLYWVVGRGGKSRAEKMPDSVNLLPVLHGYGYYGVLLCDRAGDKIQCHLCGKWYTGLSNHVYRTHNTSVDDYKSEFELGNKGLSSPEYSQRQSQKAREFGLAEKVKNPVKFSGGEGSEVHSLRGRLLSSTLQLNDNARAATSEAQKKRWENPNKRIAGEKHLNKIRGKAVRASKKVLTGKPKTKEHKQKLSQYASNRPKSHIDKLRKYSQSKVHSERTSERNKKRKQKTKKRICLELKQRDGVEISELSSRTGLSNSYLRATLKEMAKEKKVILKKEEKAYIVYLS